MTLDIPIYPRWTVDELKDMIALLKRTDFNPAEIDTDLHKRVGVDTGRAEQHSAKQRGEGSEWLCLDHIRVCGMGV